MIDIFGALTFISIVTIGGYLHDKFSDLDKRIDKLEKLCGGKNESKRL